MGHSLKIAGCVDETRLRALLAFKFYRIFPYTRQLEGGSHPTKALRDPFCRCRGDSCVPRARLHTRRIRNERWANHACYAIVGAVALRQTGRHQLPIPKFLNFLKMVLGMHDS